MTQIYSEEKFKRSQYTQFLVDKLRSLPEGDLVTYDELSDVIHGDVQYKNRHYLQSAIDIVTRDHDIVLECVTGIGYRRLSNDEISEHSTRYHQRRMQQDTAQFRRKVECVDISKLSSEDRIKHTLAATLVTMREKLTDKKTERTLTSAIHKKMDSWLPDKDAFIAAFGDKG